MSYLQDELGGCCFASNGKFARPGSKASYGPDQQFDSEHILLEISFDIPNKTVFGKCVTSLKSIHDEAREISFDAIGFKINSVKKLSGEKLKYSYDGEKIQVKTPKPLREGERIDVLISYRLQNPVAGVYFVGPDKFYPKKPLQIWTHGEAEESRYWFPCFDAPHDKATTEMIATVPGDFFALSNGALTEIRESGKTKTYHWKQSIPHSPYLVTLVAGRFSEIADEWDGIPVLYYCQPGREEDTKRAFGKTPKMLKFFSEAIGVRYPYEKYAQVAVADFVMGGMEHTTATTQTDRVLMDARAYPEFLADWLVSHELAHQWFGDLLTCKEWSHAWLNESFATYFEALFTEHDRGKDEFLHELEDKANIYFEEDRKTYRRAIVTNVYRKPDDLFDRHLYEKGAVILHMLRHELGDKLFWKSIRTYVETHSGKAVETHDFINAIQEATGKNLRKFFDQWIFGPGHPDYTVNYWWDTDKKSARVQLLQKPNGKSVFSVSVELSFLTENGIKTFKETIDQKKQDFTYRFPEEPLDFRFDPGHFILKKLQLVKPYKMWVKQLQSDPHVVGRVQAAREVAKIANAESLEHLKRAFQKEKFWGTAAGIAAAIGSLRSPNARDFLISALSVPHPKIRRGVVEGLASFQDPEVARRLSQQFQKDQSYFVVSESVKSLARSRTEKAIEVVRKGLKRDSWNNVIRAGSLQALAQFPNSESARLLKKYSAYGEELSARISAIQAMGKVAQSFPELYLELLNLTEDSQIRVKQTVISVLGDLKDPRAVPILEKISKDKNFPYRTQAAAQDALLKIQPEKAEG